MSEAMLAKYRDQIEGAYRAMTPRSRDMLKTARRFVAGGVTRATTWWQPHPIFVEHGEGCRLHDVDGNVFIDWNGCFTAALLGHSPPALVAAMREAAPRLHSAGAPTESIHEWARLLCERFASVERVRFCCSGSEAVMFACRAARAHSGRNLIMKQRGSYHGTLDAMEVDMPTSQRGIARHAAADMIYANYGNLDQIEGLIREHRDDLAGVLVNPIWFARADGGLNRLVDLARAHGVLVIADEVMSFRYAMGGAQEYFGFDADLTVFGKSIGGGGLAVGAFGGRQDIMRLFDYTDQTDPPHHSGTFAANPITVAAGVAGLREITPELLARLNGLGERLKAGLGAAFREANVRATLGGEGSLCLMSLGELEPDPTLWRFSPEQAEVRRLFGLSLLTRKMFTPADGLIWAISSPMTEREVDQAVEALRATLVEFKPLIGEAAPELLAS